MAHSVSTCSTACARAGTYAHIRHLARWRMRQASCRGEGARAAGRPVKVWWGGGCRVWGGVRQVATCVLGASWQTNNPMVQSGSAQQGAGASPRPSFPGRAARWRRQTWPPPAPPAAPAHPLARLPAVDREAAAADGKGTWVDGGRGRGLRGLGPGVVERGGLGTRVAQQQAGGRAGERQPCQPSNEACRSSHKAELPSQAESHLGETWRGGNGHAGPKAAVSRGSATAGSGGCCP